MTSAHDRLYFYGRAPGMLVINSVRDISSHEREAYRPAVSFEHVPTKTDDGERALLENPIPELKP